MMRVLLLALVLTVPPIALSDLDKAQAESHRLKTQLLAAQEQLVSCQVTLQKAVLAEQQSVLETRFRELLKPPAEAVFSWESLTFVVK